MLPFQVSQQAPSTMDRIANALQGFGAGVAGRGGEFLKNQQLQRQALSDERKQAAAEDLRRAKALIDNNDLKGLQALAQERLGYINQLGGDPSDTEQLIVLAQQAETDPIAYQRLLAEVNSGLRSAADAGFINLPQTTPIQEFEPVYDKSGNVIAQKNTTTGKVIADPRKPEDRDNFEIVYNTAGEPIGQRGRSGEIKALPEGFTPKKPAWTTLSKEQVKNYGFGDGYIVQESVDGSLKVINEEFMKASRKLDAEQREQAVEDAKTLETGISTMNLIDDLIGNQDLKKDPHPSLAAAVGWFDQWIPSTLSGTIDFETRVDQLKGKTFLTAFESLKGGGTITELEGQAATAAQARLNMAQSEEDFVASLAEMRGLIARRIEKITNKQNQTPLGDF